MCSKLKHDGLWFFQDVAFPFTLAQAKTFDCTRSGFP